VILIAFDFRFQILAVKKAEDLQDNESDEGLT